jgi:hypothetical protein
VIARVREETPFALSLSKGSGGFDKLGQNGVDGLVSQEIR